MLRTPHKVLPIYKNF